MKIRLHETDAPVAVAIREGRFWKQGRSHRVRSIVLSSLGFGLDEQFVASEAVTACGLTVEHPTLRQVAEAGNIFNACERCWRS